MVTIYGLEKNCTDEVCEHGFASDVHKNELGDFDVVLSEEIKVSFHFGTLKLEDIRDRIQLDQLDFVKVVIK